MTAPDTASLIELRRAAMSAKTQPIFSADTQEGGAYLRALLKAAPDLIAAADALASVANERDALAAVLERVLTWPNPGGTIEAYYLPGWLAAEARAALARVSVAEDTPPDTPPEEQCCYWPCERISPDGCDKKPLCLWPWPASSSVVREAPESAASGAPDGEASS